MTMTVSGAMGKYGFECVTSGGGNDNVIKDVYIGDLLSWVMGRAGEGCAWITIQAHINIVAVALLVEAACVIIAENAQVDEDTLTKANEENLPILKSKLTSYQIAALFARDE